MIKKPKSTVKRIVFVCVENSCRSQIAEAFAHIHGNDRINIYSAGSHPSGVVNPKAIDVMREKGYDLRKHHSKSLQDVPQGGYEFAVTMGCGDECPAVRARYREDWNIPDPKNMTIEEFRTMRDLIEVKVKDLLSKL
jgi:arsenate reductase